jgi:tetratricopeptide (TPR) repeat protein
MGNESDGNSDDSKPPVRTIGAIYAELGCALLRAADELRAGGKASLADPRYEEAAQAFERAIREGSRSAELELGLARAREGQRRFEDALRGYLQVVRADPSFASRALPRAYGCLSPGLVQALASWLDSEWIPALLRADLDRADRASLGLLLGRVYLYRSDYAAAVKEYRAAHEVNPDEPSVLEGLGESLWRSGATAEAVHILEHAVCRADLKHLREGAITTRQKLGGAYFEQGQHHSALRTLRQGLALAAGMRAELWAGLARIRLALGGHDGAARAAQRAIELDDHLAAPYAVLAAVRWEQSDYEKASDAAEAALVRDPSDLLTIRLAGRALLAAARNIADAEKRSIRIDKGIRLIRNYVEQSPEDQECRLELASALQSAGRPARETIDVLRKGLEVAGPEKPARLYLELAEVYRLAGDAASALRVLNEPAAQGRGADPARWWQIRGDLLSVQHDTAGALEAYEQAAQATPYDGRLHLSLALAARKAGDNARASSAVSAAIEQGVSGDDRLNAFALKAELGEDVFTGKWEPPFAALSPTEARRERLPPSDVVEAWYEAGRQFYWKGDLEPALHWLGRVTELYGVSGLRPEARWYRVDALRMRATQQKYPYWNADRLAEARRAWNEALSFRRPDAAFAWGYVSGALIADAQAQLSRPAERAALVWEAVACLERSLVLYDSNIFAWINLSRLQRAMDNHANAVLTSERARKIDPDDLNAMDECVAAFANRGDAQRARELIEKRLQRERNTWAEGARAFVAFLENDYEAAIELIGRVIANDPDDIWNLVFRGDCRRLLALSGKAPDRSRARGDYLKVLERKDNPDYQANQAAFGWAAYGAGDFQSAAAILKPLLGDALDPSCDCDRVIGCCYLRLGDLEQAEACLNRGIDFARTSVQLKTLEALLFAEIEQDAADWPNREPVRALLGRARDRISGLRTSGEWPTEPQAELRRFLLWDEARVQTNEWSQVGANAGLARVALAAGDLEQAAALYRAFLDDPRFPEAAQGLVRVAARFRELGDDALTKGWDEPDARQQAISLFEHALGLRQSVSSYGYAELLARLALARFQTGQAQEATTTFAAAAEAFKDAGADDPGEWIGAICLTFTPDVARYWLLDAYFRCLASERSAPEPLIAVLSRTVERLGDYLATALDRGAEDSKNQMLVVTPIVLEIAHNLAPPEGKEDPWPVLDRFIPEMRDRIEDEAGVTIPGVRIRGNESDLENDAYIIMLDEVPVVLGRISSGAKYSPSPASALEAAGVPLADLQQAPHPLSKQPGWWIPEQHWDRVQQAKDCTLWPDPMQYVVAHLEAVLRSNLADFLGVQEVANLLDRWGRADTQRELIKAALPDVPARDHFVRVLRAVVRERVPITAPALILTAVREVATSADEIYEVVRRVRLAIKTELPANRRGARLVSVPLEIERAIMRHVATAEGRRFFAAPPDEAQELLSRLRALGLRDDPATVLVTEDPQVRDPCRRLVELEFPSIPVQSRDELIAEKERDMPLAWVPLIAEWGELWPQSAVASHAH